MKAKLKGKGHLLNRNFTSYQVGNHVCGALTIEMNEITCCNKKPKTFFASEKKWSQNHQKSRFKRSGSDLSA